jgi:putative Mn2+ efflux pump MntP
MIERTRQGLAILLAGLAFGLVADVLGRAIPGRLDVALGAATLVPLIGYLAGLGLKSYITGVDHWVAFGLLLFVGGKMVYEAFQIESAEKNRDPSNLPILLALAVATSIDALAVGITLSFLTSAIALAVTLIGLITFGLSFAGVYIGKRFGHFFESRIEIVGGLILIGIGVKILVQHLMA